MNAKTYPSALQLGDDAPDFTAETTEGTFRFHEWLGDSWGVLFSHPKDFTPVCTTELGEVARIKPEFDRRNVKVIGLSVDSLDAHRRWASDIEETQGQAPNFPLIADPDRVVSDLYGMIHPNASDTTTVRSVFVIGPDKKVKLTITYPQSTGRNFDEILRVIDSLQLTAAHKVSTPVNWTQGDDVIISPAVDDDEARARFPGGWKTLKPYLRVGPPTGVIFTQHYLGCLSHASYVIGDETTGRALVVDPRRDVDVYREEAARRGLVIERIIETHVHADFLSGHLELAARTGAVICYGAGAAVQFPVEHLHDGQRLELGVVTVEVLSTPGHTPESISLVIHEHADDPAPFGVLTGDTLFVGDVGRPDLLASGGAETSAEALARTLFRSLHEKLLRLPDSTRVFPAHGAGSACGKQLSNKTSSTIGDQRRTNYALQVVDEDLFVAVVTEGQPPRPDYFEFDARRNRERRTLLDDRPPPLLTLDAVLQRRHAGAVLLDPREPADFAAGHLRSAVNVGLQGRFAEWAADVLSPHRDVVLVGDPALAGEAKLRLGRVGYDRVVGQLDDLGRAMTARPDVIESSSWLTVAQLAALVGSAPELQIVDVRAAAETRTGALPHAREIPLPELVGAIDSIDRARPVVVYCASGYRSQIAASVLRAAGFADVSDLIGGTAAWEQAGYPISRGLLVHRVEPLNCETSIDALIGGVVVPAERFYVRNHFPTPVLDPATWRLAVGGLVERPLSLGLRELRSMPSQTLMATLECAGNGRSRFEPAIAGEPWRLGAVSTAEWTGVQLADVLERARPRAEVVEVVLRGADRGPVEGREEAIAFERSLSIDDARRPEVLLAYAMNGEALPPEHGRPVRLVVPGRYAVASVKWLTGITLVDAAFAGYFQADRYVYEWEQDGVVVREPVGGQQVRALITEPGTDTEVERGEVMVRGLAWSGSGPIASVEVWAGDGPWEPARLVGEPHPHCWQWWERLVRLEDAGPTTLRARATDVAGRTQPEEAPWNRLGYGNNSIQAVEVHVR